MIVRQHSDRSPQRNTAPKQHLIAQVGAEQSDFFFKSAGDLKSTRVYLPQKKQRSAQTEWVHGANAWSKECYVVVVGRGRTSFCFYAHEACALTRCKGLAITSSLLLPCKAIRCTVQPRLDKGTKRLWHSLLPASLTSLIDMVERNFYSPLNSLCSCNQSGSRIHPYATVFAKVCGDIRANLCPPLPALQVHKWPMRRADRTCSACAYLITPSGRHDTATQLRRIRRSRSRRLRVQFRVTKLFFF